MFHEEIFPFHIVIEADHMMDPFPDLVLSSHSLSIPQNMSITSNPTPLDEFSITHIDPDKLHPNLSSNTDIRKSQRVFRPPKYLRDFYCNLIFHSNQSCAHSPHHIRHFISYNNLSYPHQHLIWNVSS